MICRLAADDARSVTAFNDLAGMAFVLDPDTNYSFEFVLFCTANAATVGVQFELSFGGTVTSARVVGRQPAVASPSTETYLGDTTAPFTLSFIASHGANPFECRITGTIEVGASGGTLQLRHASETATLTTVLRGSYGVCVES